MPLHCITIDLCRLFKLQKKERPSGGTMSQAQHRRLYIKEDKFFLPRYSYWAAFGLMLLAALVIPYIIARSFRWVRDNLGSASRLVVAVVIIVGSAPGLDLLTRKMLEHGLSWDPMAVLLLFLVLISMALSVATPRLRFLPFVFVWNTLFGGAALLLIYIAVRLVTPINAWYDFVLWPIFAWMFALSFGTWIIWRERLVGQRSAERSAWSGLAVSGLVLLSCVGERSSATFDALDFVLQNRRLTVQPCSFDRFIHRQVKTGSTPTVKPSQSYSGSKIDLFWQ